MLRRASCELPSVIVLRYPSSSPGGSADQLPEDIRLPSGAADIARRKMVHTLDESDIEPMPHGMIGKGTPPGPRDTSYERPALVPPKSKSGYRYMATFPDGVKRFSMKAFHGPQRWATLVPTSTEQAIPETSGQKPFYLTLRIRVHATNEEYDIHTDTAAMHLLAEHEEAHDILAPDNWRGRTTYDIVFNWEMNRIAAEAVQAALAEEGPSSSTSADSESDTASDASDETCVSFGDNDEDSLDWSSFIDTSMCSNEEHVIQGPTFA